MQARVGSEVLAGEIGRDVTLPATLGDGTLLAKGYYTDAEKTVPAGNLTFTETAYTVYADVATAYYKQNFDNIKDDSIFDGEDTDTALYEKVYKDDRFVHSGDYSVYRKGITTSGFGVIDDDSVYLKLGEDYTVSMYVKPVSVNANATVSLVNTYSICPDTETDAIAQIDISSLELNKWDKVSTTFTAKYCYLTVLTSAGCELYIDDVVIRNNAVAEKEESYTDSAIYATGDTDHDGKVTAKDLVKIRKILLGVETFEYIVPVDLNNDNIVNLLDLVCLKKLLS